MISIPLLWGLVLSGRKVEEAFGGKHHGIKNKLEHIENGPSYAEMKQLPRFLAGSSLQPFILDDMKPHFLQFFVSPTDKRGEGGSTVPLVLMSESPGAALLGSLTFPGGPPVFRGPVGRSVMA